MKQKIQKNKKKHKKYFNISDYKSNYRDIGLIACILVLLIYLTIVISLQGSVITDDKTYDIIRKAETGLESDPLIEKEWNFKSDIFLKPLINFINYEKVIIVLLVLTTIITLLLLRPMFKDKSLFFFVLLMSPIYLRVSASFNDYIFLALFLSAFSYLIIKKNYIPAFIIYIPIIYLNYYIGMSIIFIISYLYFSKKIKFYHLILFLIPLISFFRFEWGNKFIIKMNILERIFTDFGSYYGIPLILATLGCISLVIFWKKLQTTKYIFIISVIICFFDLIAGLFLISTILVFLTATLIEILIKEKWENHSLKQISILLIFCSLLFSSVGFISENLQLEGQEELKESIIWLKENTHPGSIILSHYKYGNKLKFFGEKNIIIDEDLNAIKDGKKKYEDTNTIFHSRNRQATTELLEKYNTNYILITKEMKKGLIWNKESEGLLFVMATDPAFTRIFENNNTEIWQFEILENN